MQEAGCELRSQARSTCSLGRRSFKSDSSLVRGHGNDGAPPDQSDSILNIVGINGPNLSSISHIGRRCFLKRLIFNWLVDVTGIEPVTPCLQSNPRNVMWLILLAFTYVT